MTREEFLDKCIAFSVKINKLRKYLRENQHEYNNSDHPIRYNEVERALVQTIVRHAMPRAKLIWFIN